MAHSILLHMSAFFATSLLYRWKFFSKYIKNVHVLFLGMVASMQNNEFDAFYISTFMGAVWRFFKLTFFPEFQRDCYSTGKKDNSLF